ncbi:MAG: hypothetical protein OHK0029_18140 [Armatimonadaceae bacterium]
MLVKHLQEVWVTDDAEEAVRKAKITLKRVGELTEVIPDVHIKGNIRFGVHAIPVTITWHSERLQSKEQQAANISGDMGTVLLLEAEAEDQSGASQRDVVERFEDAYRHFDRPDYAPDRLGVAPLTIIGIVVAVFLLIVFLLVNPKTRKMLPQLPTPAESEQKPNATTEANP